MVDRGPRTSSDVYAEYGFTYPTPTTGNRYNSKKAHADVLNQIGMALLNQDIENQQWERNTAWNSEAARFMRMLAIGMNPLTAMQAIAGQQQPALSSGLPQGHYSSSSMQPNSIGSDLLGAGNLMVGSAQQFAKAQDDIASANLKNVQAGVLPGQVRSLQDLQRSESQMNGWLLDFRKATADLDISSKAISNRVAEAEDALKRIMKQQYDQAIQLQKRELAWFDIEHTQQYIKGLQEIRNLVSTEHLLGAQARQANSQANLNDAQRTKVIPAQVDYLGKQGNLVDAQGRLVDQQTFNQQVQNVQERFKVMHDQTGMPYNVMGAMLLQDLDDKMAFDELGQLKSGTKLYDETSSLGGLMKSMMNVDAKSYDDAHNVAVQTVISGYINSGCQVINTAATATNAVTGARVGNSVIQKNTPIAPTVIQGFGR